MSYILEALKKAEAERRSGSAPSIHAPHTYAPAAGSNAWWRRPSLLAGALAVLLAGTAGAWLLTRPSVPSPAPTPASPSPATVAAAPAPAPAAVAPPAAPAPPPKQAAQAPAPREKEKPAKKPVEKQPPATRKAESQPAPLPTLRELPEQLQREIPQLQVGGYIYSGNKADRTVVINRRLLREGDEVAPGLVLEQLMPNGMVLNYQGRRYRSSY